MPLIPIPSWKNPVHKFPCCFRQLLLLPHIHQGFLTKMSAILFSTIHVTCPSQIKFLDSIIWIIKTPVRHWNYEVSKRICSNPLLLPSLRSKYSPQLLALSVCYQLPCYATLLKKYCMLRKPQYNTVSCVVHLDTTVPSSDCVFTNLLAVQCNRFMISN